MDKDTLLFQEESPNTGERLSTMTPWPVLVVDDDQSVHDITRLALADFEYQDRPLELIFASSAAEAQTVLTDREDIAVALVDVVMESDQAGLELVRWIRQELKNEFIRLILRTGQPGQAPEHTVILNFDINDYKEKTELSVGKMHTLMVTSLRSYANLMALEKSRSGLERMVASSRMLSTHGSLESFIQGVLQQLQAILGGREHAFYSRSFGVVGDGDERNAGEQVLIAGTGDYAASAHRKLNDVGTPEIIDLVRQAVQQRQSICGERECVIYFSNNYGNCGVLYLELEKALDETERHLVDLFCSNTNYAFDNLHLNREIEKTQREIVFTLGTIAEFRSRETGHHIRRVSRNAQLLGQLYGLNEKECELLLMAMPMHDIGKIAIPDAILHKPGALDDDEWKIMKTHAALGADMLKGANLTLFRAAAIIAEQHHEKWDGTGYPAGLSGESIHLYARIASLSDVFDALSHERAYKHAWPLDQVIEFFRDQRGKHFDPELTDLLLEHVDKFVAIAEEYRDGSESNSWLTV
ncbi:MAG: DUF3369 domain-containing protein [bacterium]